MNEKRIGLLGATSLVGQCLLPLLRQNGWQIIAFSRCQINSCDQDIQWILLKKSADNHSAPAGGIERIDFWICVAPPWVLPDLINPMVMCPMRLLNQKGCTNKLTIHIPMPKLPAELGLSTDSRKLGLGLVRVRILGE